MSHPIKDLGLSSDRWVRRASISGPDYTAGIQAPRTPWASAAVAAEKNYVTGVTQAANQGRYGRGVKRAGEERWRSMALRKGPGRFIEGVSIGRDDWAKGFGPYHSAIAALVLPPRGPRRSPTNLDRVRLITETLGRLYEARAKA